MDYNGMVAGVTLMLPVSEPGALLFVGDGHARQGDGEVVGNALEVSMDVEFTVDLIKEGKIGWPRMETDEHIMTLGSARPLLQAQVSLETAPLFRLRSRWKRLSADRFEFIMIRCQKLALPFALKK